MRQREAVMEALLPHPRPFLRTGKGEFLESFLAASGGADADDGKGGGSSRLFTHCCA